VAQSYRDVSFWFDTLPEPIEPRAPLEGDAELDVAIVGAGYSGLWTAYYLKRLRPALRIGIVEARQTSAPVTSAARLLEAAGHSIERLSPSEFEPHLLGTQPFFEQAICASLASLAAELDPLPAREDFDGMAALVAELDLVISVDTSIAHLAGALAKPAWLLLPFAPDWRWRLGRDDSAWYPTLRLFRQQAARDWPPVVERIGAALRAWAPSQR